MNQANPESGEHPRGTEPPPDNPAAGNKPVGFSAHKNRWLSGLPLFVGIAAAVLWGPVWLLALILALGAVLALGELDLLLEAGPFGVESGVNRIMCVLTMGLACWGPGPAWGGLGAAMAVNALVSLSLENEPKAMRSALVRHGFGLVYCVLPLACLLLLAQLEAGRLLVLFCVVSVAAADMGAYYAGHAWGRRKLAPRLSPGKTWEGFWGGLAAAGVLGALTGLSGVFAQPVWQVILAAFILAGLSVLGDLFESVMKRSAGVKDSGSILPGHGGILDRMDGLLFAAPAVYLIKVLWWI